MPRRDDLHTILIIGSGPIVIGQACEFDYSGAQACKALRQEGYRVVLINSNPATIMTDPAMADRTYVEPITPEAVKKILIKERELGTPIDAVLPTLGGQTALNTACKLWDDGVFQEFGVEMIGADRAVIHRAEDREEFKKVCERLGISTGIAKTVNSLDDALEFLKEIGLPAIIRPAFTLGGSGGGVAYNIEEFKDIITRGLDASMIHQVQIDKSLLGWKEYELEVVRDKKDNCVIVCGIENFDPMGVHTGDSITVAPILTLTDKEYQVLRDASIAIMREVGVECGGSNVQFAVDPDPADGKFHFIAVEMNPRVSRSSALASKATGFPIAKIAAKLAVGYTLDELRNDITGTTSACFEPTIDYIVVKMPRWTFEKFPEADETLTTQMKSVGEAMAIGRTFKEALQKVIRSMEVKRFGLGLDRNDKWLAAMRAVEHQQLVLDFSPGALPGTGSVSDTGLRTADGQPIEWPIPLDKLTRKLAVPSQGRLYFIRYAMKMGWSVDKIASLTRIDPFFLDQIRQLVEFEDTLCSFPTLEAIPAEVLFEAKQHGYSDPQLANLFLGTITTDTILKVRRHRQSLGIEPVYKCVDTCAAEFEAITPYYYSTYERGFEVISDEATERRSDEGGKAARPRDSEGAHRGSPSVAPSLRRSVTSPDDEIRRSEKPKVVIIGGGPNRIGQGIEFDYCCVHAALTARDMGFESVMINSNPETVSTDYDTSDLLFFEPLTLEDVLNIVERLDGVRQIDLGYSDRPGFEKLIGKELPMLDFNSVHGTLVSTLRANGQSAGLVVGFCTTHRNDSIADGVGVTIVCPGGNVYSIHWNLGETPKFETEDLSTWVATTAFYRWAKEMDPSVQEWLARSSRSSVTPSLRHSVTSGLVHGLIVQFGGQTPLNLARGLVAAGCPIIGTSIDSIDLAEDRDRFDALLTRLNLKRPESGIARSLAEAIAIASRIGYPVLVRPSYVLGGRGMEICSDEKTLRDYITNALEASDFEGAPVLIDKFLDGAVEVDVDVVADYEPSSDEATKRRSEEGKGGDRLGTEPSTAEPSVAPSLRRSVASRAVICGVMQHIEHAGIHSGDSSCCVPPWSLPTKVEREIREISRKLAEELRVCGLMNVQMAVKDDEVYILEVNPRASRTAPFVAKAKNIPWPAVAARCMLGESLDEQGMHEVRDTGSYAVKAPVFPHKKFPGVDFVLGPEMRSTGEVMGIDVSMPVAYLKAMLGAGIVLPRDGGVFISVRESDKPAIADVARSLMAMGFKVYTTDGTAAALKRHGLRPHILPKVGTGLRPNVLDLMSDGSIGLIINTPTRTGWQTDEGRIRATAIRMGIPMLTTVTAAAAAIRAIEAQRAGDWDVAALQDYAASAVSASHTSAAASTR